MIWEVFLRYKRETSPDHGKQASEPFGPPVGGLK
jgi:hypothetical protein